MGLLEHALRASGGLEQRRLKRRFTLHVSMSGPLITAKCGIAQLRELAVEGSAHEQAVDITGFTSADLRALYRPDWVALEGPDGQRLMWRQAVPQEFRKRLRSATRDYLQLAHYCAYLLWNYLATPFILADPDFETQELARSREPGESLRRLRVAFPARVVTHATVQTFFFDREGLLRRLDYPAIHAEGRTVDPEKMPHRRSLRRCAL